MAEHQPAGWADKTVTSRFSIPGPYWVTALPDSWLLEQAAEPGRQINAKALSAGRNKSQTRPNNPTILITDTLFSEVPSRVPPTLRPA